MLASRWVGITCVAAVCLASSERSEAARTVMRLRLPEPIDPGSMTVIKGSYGHGLGVGQMQMRSDTREYELKLSDGYNRLKLLIYAPGYRMVTADFDETKLPLTKPFVPRFVKLPTAEVTFRLVRTNGKPVANQQVTLRHDLGTHGYFGYLDGMAFDAVLATVSTDAKGEARLSLPLVQRDPYFTAVKPPLTAVGLSLGSNRGRDEERDLRPSRLELRDSYPQPVVITVIGRATLSGRVEKSFLAKHHIGSDNMKPSSNPYVAKTAEHVMLDAKQVNGRWTYNCMLMPDGKFSCRLPAGTYDLFLRVLDKGGAPSRDIAVRNGLVLREGEEKALVVK